MPRSITIVPSLNCHFIEWQLTTLQLQGVGFDRLLFEATERLLLEATKRLLLEDTACLLFEATERLLFETT